MNLKFTKMHGTGNDFVVLNGIRQALTLTPDLVRWLADRHRGVGADQVLIVERPTVADADFKYRIFNADGTEVEHCGNGARCFVKFVYESGLTDKRTIRAQIQKGMLTLTLQENGSVAVEMGVPQFEPAAVAFNEGGLQSQADGADCLWPLEILDKNCQDKNPCLTSEARNPSVSSAFLRQESAFETLPYQEFGENSQNMPLSSAHLYDEKEQLDTQPLRAKTKFPSKLVWLSLVSMGNPHAVQTVDDVETAPVLQEGAQIESHPRFLERVNVSFMQVIDHHNIRLRVYERGVGETLACGTAACAAVVAGIRRQLLTSPVLVNMRGGQLTIHWHGKQVKMLGPAVTVFDGELTVEPSEATALHYSTRTRQ